MKYIWCHSEIIPEEKIEQPQRFRVISNKASKLVSKC